MNIGQGFPPDDAGWIGFVVETGGTADLETGQLPNGFTGEVDLTAGDVSCLAGSTTVQIHSPYDVAFNSTGGYTTFFAYPKSISVPSVDSVWLVARELTWALDEGSNLIMTRKVTLEFRDYP